MTGYRPPSSGRNTSQRSTVPSSMGIGTSQSMRIPLTLSECKNSVVVGAALVALGMGAPSSIEVFAEEIQRQAESPVRFRLAVSQSAVTRESMIRIRIFMDLYQGIGRQLPLQK